MGIYKIRIVDEVDVRAPDLFRTQSLHFLKEDRSADLDRREADVRNGVVGRPLWVEAV